jgi:hypothetical protein
MRAAKHSAPRDSEKRVDRAGDREKELEGAMQPLGLGLIPGPLKGRGWQATELTVRLRRRDHLQMAPLP